MLWCTAGHRCCSEKWKVICQLWMWCRLHSSSLHAPFLSLSLLSVGRQSQSYWMQHESRFDRFQGLSFSEERSTYWCASLFFFFPFFENTYNAALLHESQVCAGNYCRICANMWLTLNMLRPNKALCDCRCISTCFNGQQMSHMNDEQLAAPDTRLITLSSLPLFHRVCLFWLFFFSVSPLKCLL